MSQMTTAAKPPLLFISRWFPYPPDNGARMRVYALLRELSQDYEVHLLSFVADGQPGSAALDGLSFCRSVVTARQPVYSPGALKSLLGLFSPLPRWAVATRSADMQAAVAGSAARIRPQVVIASEIDMAPYAAQVDAPVRLLEELEISGYIDRRDHAAGWTARLRHALTWWKFRRYVAGLLPQFQAVTVVSAREQREVAAIAPRGSPPAVIIPNGVEPALLECDFGAPEADTLVYSGALTYSANLDAVAYFTRDIFPMVLARRPGARLFVTGQSSPELIARLGFGDLPAGRRVTFTGYLDDVRPRVARSAVSIVPLRQGGGTRLKILEALALGTPVVATPKGAEGLELPAGEAIEVAGEPRAFAGAVVALLEDPGRRARFSAAGRRAAAGYAWPLAGARLRELISGRLAATR
jgi:glycosyltransferase involved in cell wall biosynthesis